ncbi:transferase [Parabacteroides distasonis]|nr:transferase [Parabacteroides distasonis]
MSIKHFFEVYSPKRMWRKLWLGLASLPMLPQHRAKILKLGGVNFKGRALIYGGVVMDTVAPENIYIGKNVAITAGTTILTHYLDPTRKGRMFRIGEVHIEDDVFIGVNTIICNSVTIGEGAIIGAGSVVTKDIPPYQCWAGNPARYIKDRNH